MAVQIYGYSDPGKKNTTNQDDILYDQKMQINILADGVGSRKGGRSILSAKHSYYF